MFLFLGCLVDVNRFLVRFVEIEVMVGFVFVLIFKLRMIYWDMYECNVLDKFDGEKFVVVINWDVVVIEFVGLCCFIGFVCVFDYMLFWE